MINLGQLDGGDVNVVFVGSTGDTASTNRRLLRGCGRRCSGSIQLLQDDDWGSGNNLWVELDGVKDSFYVYGSDGSLEEEWRDGLDLRNSASARATLLGAIGVPTKAPTRFPSRTKFPVPVPTPFPRSLR